VSRTAAIHREREEAAEQAKAYDGRAHAPKFRGANLTIQSYTGREWLLSGPSETGKTWATLWRLDSLLRATPGAKATLLRKVQADIHGTVIVTWQAIQLLREAMGEVPAQEYGGQKPNFYTYPNGARLWCGGLDHASKILSGERDWIYVNQAEELAKEDWETLTTRTTGRGAVTPTPMLFGDCNPGGEDHWIQKREDLKLFHSRHVDNPSLYDDAGNITPQGRRSMATLMALTGVRKKRLYHGLWVGAEGLFFEHYDPEDTRIVIPPLDFLPGDWPVWGALDWGHKHPLAFGLFAEDNEGNIHLVWEHVQAGWLIPYHCRAIREGLKRFGVWPEKLETIAAGHDVFTTTGGSHLEDLKTKAMQFADSKDPVTKQDNGLILDYANIDRKQGAAELTLRIGNPSPGLQIEPTLKIWSHCTRTVATLARMVHNPRDPEDVLKVNADPLTAEGGDDAYDMLRYGVMVKAGGASYVPAVGGSRGTYQTL